MSSTMRFLSYLVTLLVAALLTSCGGGGGSAGAITGSDALRTNVPSGLTVVVGLARSFNIEGGKAPYSVISNNEGVAVGGVSGSTLILGAVFPGTAQLIVRDALGASVAASITVTENGLALFSTAPTSLTIPMGPAGAQTFRVGGGVGPYSVTSSNSSIVSAVLINQSLTITGITPGSTTVTLRDSLSAAVNISVTVTTVGNLALFTTAPLSINLPIGATTQVFAVGGGVGPYLAASSNTAIATVSLTGTTLTISGVAQGPATITIRDSVNTTIAINVTVPAPNAIYSNAPSPVSIAIGSAPVFSINGGLPPYTLKSSDVTVATVAPSGTGMAITALKGGTATIQVRDSVGTLLAVTVNVPFPIALYTTAPSSVTIAVASSPTYTIGGGTAPYTATSANTAIATSTVTGSTTFTLTINGVSGGATSVVIRDAAGATIPVAVNVATSGGPLFTSAPAAGISIPLGSPQTYSVGGGSGTGYTATSSNTGVVTVSAITSGNLTITPVSPGSATVVVRDSAGATVNISVIVPTVNNQALFTSAPTAGVTLALASSQTYVVGGGTSPYIVTSDDTSVATVSRPSSTSYAVTGVKAGSANIQIRDSAAGVITLKVTVSAATTVALSTTAPSAVTLAVSTSQVYSISGGTGTYTVTNTNPFNANAAVSGSGPAGGTLTIDGLLVGGTSITIRDGGGSQVVIAITVTQPGSTLALLPATLSIDERYNGEIDLSIFGGVAPFFAFSTDTVIAPVAIAGSQLQVTAVGATVRCGIGASVTLTVIDSLGASATSVLTIINSNGAAGCTP